MIYKEDNGSKIDLEEIKESVDEEPIVNTDTQQEVVTPISDSTLSELDEPANYKEAMASPEAAKWKEAMKSKIQSMYDNQVWNLVDTTPGLKMVGCKWIFKKKTDMDGKVHTYKARLVAKGYTQTHRIDYEETFSPVAKIKSIRIMLAIAAFHDYEIWQMDVKTAFLNEKLTEDQSCMTCTRPDVSFDLSMVSRHQQNPDKGHWTVVKNILKYLRNTKDVFLVYGREEKLKLNGGAEIRKCSKQDIVADSTCESEYIAACEASKEAIWMMNFIRDLEVVPTVQYPIEIFCDNESAVALTK
ncbi:putative retrotransposon protein [Tanacetum coccineum]